MKGGKVGIYAMFDPFFSPKRDSKGSSHTKINNLIINA